jgi:uncharacterized protein (DUF1501 family)
MHIKRRSFLQLTATAAAAVAAPTLLFSRKARAATNAFDSVRHVLILHAQGGFRSHCTFNAVGSPQHNPFGVQPAAEGTQWALGAACGRESYTSGLGTVPSFAEVTNDVAVLACVDSNPGGLAEIDHVAGHRRAATGFAQGETGLLSLVGAHHKSYADGFTRETMPPVEIVPTDMGLGAGSYGERRPLSLLGAQAGTSGGLAVREGWHTEARRVLDESFLARRSRAYAKRLRNFRTSKQNAALFAAMLQDPKLDVLNAPDATDAGVTNQQLLEVLGNHDLSEIGDPQPGMQSWGADVALALRCFSLGAPVGVVTRAIYDMHDVERDAYAARTQDLVRQLAGLHFLLQRMEHPEGGTYWDKTLVVTLSEFSRNNTFADTGFNSGNGSDHVTTDDGPARNQAIAVMGGAVTQKGKLIGATDENMNATAGVIDMRSLLSTLLDVIGIEGREHLGKDPIAELFV